ncbi:potassium-transporting ATPase subunit KdpC [Oryzomonas rubra]|uniref:Potassium-transporting ATPase KdpC subunit n=1 Tax=Oryzomonas rubra TaxID=2509454 RepID=A0A5A9XMC6_9BACT|nr:potassium-transporting ATPase subunit KdpC [Oryzomonas rubra]KAA0893299.1 potassium-transporting ATPase subunit KdpC [Oryzomonas rubra]
MNDLRSAILMFLVFTIICGGVYPAIVTGVASAVFPHQAAGSFITDADSKEAGSALIGQPFSAPKYFWPRPSATTDFAYNPMASGGSNAGPTTPDFIKTVGDRIASLRTAGVADPIPADLVLASASGLDPHITPAAARLQIPRIAKARRLDEGTVAAILSRSVEDRQMGFLGESRVNVLMLNLALDRLKP